MNNKINLKAPFKTIKLKYANLNKLIYLQELVEFDLLFKNREVITFFLQKLINLHKKLMKLTLVKNNGDYNTK